MGLITGAAMCQLEADDAIGAGRAAAGGGGGGGGGFGGALVGGGGGGGGGAADLGCSIGRRLCFAMVAPVETNFVQ